MEPPLKFAKLEEENERCLEIGIRISDLESSEFPKFRNPQNSDEILMNIMKFCAFFKKRMGKSTNDTIFANITDLIILMTGVERRTVIEKMSEFQLLDWVTNYEPGRIESPAQPKIPTQIEMPSGSPTNYETIDDYPSTSIQSSSSSSYLMQQPSTSSRVFVAQIVKKPAPPLISHPPAAIIQRNPTRCVMKQAHHIINKLILQYPYSIFTWESFLLDIPSNMSSFPTKLVNTAFSQLKEQKLIYQCDSRRSEQTLYIVKETRPHCLNPLYLYGYSVEDYIENMVIHCKTPLFDQLRNFDEIFRPNPENPNYFPMLMNTFALAIMQFPNLTMDLSGLEMSKTDMAVRALAFLEAHNIITICVENNGVKIQKLTNIGLIEEHLKNYGLTKELFMKMLKKSIEMTQDSNIGRGFDEFGNGSPLDYFPLMSEDQIKTEIDDFVVVKQEIEEEEEGAP